MISFKQIITANEVENLEGSAYLLGTRAFYLGEFCLPPAGVEQEFVDGYEDAKFLSSLERFEDRVAN